MNLAADKGTAVGFDMVMSDRLFADDMVNLAGDTVIVS